MKLSDGEKLILLMLCEIYEHLGIRGDYDPRFIKSAILNRQTWGIASKLSGVPWDSKDPPPEVRDAMNFLDMWSCIEGSFAGLSQEDKKRVEAAAGGNPTFRGFDGNHETEHMSVARFLIDDLDRYSRFKDRDLNSHMPMLAAYRRMYAVFEPMRHSLIGDPTADQLIEVLMAEDRGG